MKDNASNEVTGCHSDVSADFVATAHVVYGLDRWFEESSREGFDQSAKRIQEKIVVIYGLAHRDQRLAEPVPASANNGEGYFISKGNRDVADVYGVDVLRLYDHYHARNWLKYLDKPHKKGKTVKPPEYTADSAWAAKYYKDGNIKKPDRNRFILL